MKRIDTGLLLLTVGLLWALYESGQRAQQAQQVAAAALCAPAQGEVYGARVLCDDGMWYPAEEPGGMRILVWTALLSVPVGALTARWLPKLIARLDAAWLPRAKARTLADVDASRGGGGLTEGPNFQAIDFRDGNEWRAHTFRGARTIEEYGPTTMHLDAMGITQIRRAAAVAQVRPKDFDALWHAVLCSRVAQPIEEIHA